MLNLSAIGKSLYFRTASVISAYLWIAIPFAQAQDLSKPVRLIATGIHYAGQITYKYQVINNGDKPISRIVLGISEENPNFSGGLNVLPDWAPESIDTKWFPPTSVSQPAGWGSTVASYFENGGAPGIDWIEGSYYRRINRAAPVQEYEPPVLEGGRMIGPGQSSDAFSVSLSEPDYAYVKTLARITYGVQFISVQVEKGDVTPPSLDMRAWLASQSNVMNGMAEIHLHGRAVDNLDPAPDIALAPVTANQPLEPDAVVVEPGKHGWRVKLKNVAGRVYQIRMVATDASGNSTDKIFTYDVNASVR